MLPVSPCSTDAGAMPAPGRRAAAIATATAPATASPTTAGRRVRSVAAVRLLPENAGVPERVAPGLRPDAQAVRALSHRNLREQLPVARVDRVDDSAPPPGQPEHASVGRDVSHVGAAAAGDQPLLDDAARAEADDGDAPLGAIRGVEIAPVATGVQTVRAAAGGKEADDRPAPAVDLPQTAANQVGHVEHASVRRQLHVLRHRADAE